MMQPFTGSDDDLMIIDADHDNAWLLVDCARATPVTVPVTALATA
jgi:hypothetical protein